MKNVSTCVDETELEPILTNGQIVVAQLNGFMPSGQELGTGTVEFVPSV